MDYNYILLGLLVLLTTHGDHISATVLDPAGNPDCLTEVDNPCDEDNHETLRDPTRSTGYGGDVSTNDYNLDSGWYRYVSQAGTDMPTTAPAVGQCNSQTPMWLDDTLPTVAEGNVKKRVCTRHFTGECVRAHSICVKNCGQFNVYYLYTPGGSTDRYCFGKESPCPEGQSSQNGYTPGCKDVRQVFTKNPTLTYEVKDVPIKEAAGFCKGTVFYQCNIDHDDKNIDVSIEWLVNDMVIKGPDMIKVADLPAELSTQEIVKSKVVEKYGFTVGCRLTPKTDEPDTIGISKTAEFYAGYSVNTKVLSLKEGGDPVDYVIDFTVPCLCSHRCNSELKCRLPVNVKVPKSKQKRQNTQCPNADEVVFRRATAEKINGFCTNYLETLSDGKNTQFKLPVHARLDGKYDGQKQMALQLSTPKIIDDELCQNIDFPTAQVVVEDEDVSIKGKSCRFYNDPHARSFDGRLFEMQLAGFFTLYQHTQLPIRVEGYFKQQNRYTQVCGAAIRSGGDMYVVNYCGGKKQISYNKMYECEQDKAGAKSMTIILTGKNHDVMLATGTRVIITPGSIEIRPSVADIHKTEGLCGLLNGKQNDDFKVKGSNTQDSGRYPNKFSNSWRVPDKTSMFYGKLNDERKFGDVVYCGCDKPDEATCGYTENLDNCLTTVKGNDITENLRRMCRISKRAAEESSDDLDDSDDMIFEFDINFKPPESDVWDNGWTKEEARQYCENFYKSDTINLCKNMPGIDLGISVKDCMEDIRLTDTTNFARVQTELIIESCVNEIDKNVTLSETMTSGQDGEQVSMAQMLLSRLCPSDCSGNGMCDNGTCICYDDFSGIDCSVDISKPPVLLPLPYNGLCDKKIRPCQAAVVHANEFIESDKLLCKTQLISDNNAVIGDPYINGSEFEHYQKVICPLPTRQTSQPYDILISVCNDGQTFSQTKKIKVYDSRLYTCDDSHNCKIVTTSGSVTQLTNISLHAVFIVLLVLIM